MVFFFFFTCVCLCVCVCFFLSLCFSFIRISDRSRKLCGCLELLQADSSHAIVTPTDFGSGFMIVIALTLDIAWICGKESELEIKIAMSTTVE